MRKLAILIIAALLLFPGVHKSWANNLFKFPQRIQYKMLKNNLIVGECYLLYQERTNQKGISSLKLKNFQGLGFTSRQSFHTYIFTDNSSIYATFLLEGKEKIYEIRLKEGLTFDLKKERFFVYKEEAKSEIQAPLYTQYHVIDLFTSFFVTSKRVALGDYKKTEKFNLLFDKSTKVVEMKYMGCQKSPFQGKEVFTDLLTITTSNIELFRMNIFTDRDGYCFPVAVLISYPGETFEMRADRVSK